MGSQTLEISGSSIEACGDSNVLLTTFPDAAELHQGLIKSVLSLEDQSETDRHVPSGGGGGNKVHHVERWRCPEGEIIHARAIALFKLVLGVPHAAVDLSWANVYRSGDYCAPHSHRRTKASVVYFVSHGDVQSDNPSNGRFSFADPRLEQCCQQQAGRLTTPYGPRMTPGTMLIFPSELVHWVHPYLGETPRISMSWNIDILPIPGDPMGG